MSVRGCVSSTETDTARSVVLRFGWRGPEETVSEAARLLGISRIMMKRRLNRYGVRDERAEGLAGPGRFGIFLQ